jgi:hypothetical protein
MHTHRRLRSYHTALSIVTVGPSVPATAQNKTGILHWGGGQKYFSVSDISTAILDWIDNCLRSLMCCIYEDGMNKWKNRAAEQTISGDFLCYISVLTDKCSSNKLCTSSACSQLNTFSITENKYTRHRSSVHSFWSPKHRSRNRRSSNFTRTGWTVENDKWWHVLSDFQMFWWWMDNEWFAPHSSQVTLKSHIACKWNKSWSTTATIPQMKKMKQWRII